MIVSMSNPASIVAWWKVWPERHDPCLEDWARTQPEFAPAIREAQRRIAADPTLAGLLVQAAVARRVTTFAPELPAERMEDLYEAEL